MDSYQRSPAGCPICMNPYCYTKTDTDKLMSRKICPECGYTATNNSESGGYGTYNIVTKTHGAQINSLPEPGPAQDDLIKNLIVAREDEDMMFVTIQIYKNGKFFNENGKEVIPFRQ
jgi:hypothetical protein